MVAVSVKNKVILEMPDRMQLYRLERKRGNGEWLVASAAGFALPEGAAPVHITGSYVDIELEDGLYQYRVREVGMSGTEYDYSMWVRCGNTGPIGYTFGNYQAPEGRWGQVVTADDLRYTFLWGVDFKASNGEAFTDEQIAYQIEVAQKQIERQLNITLRKTRIRCDPGRRGLQKGVDYDEEENYYTYSRAKIQRNGLIDLRKRPVLSVSRLDLMSRHNSAHSLLDAYTLDKTKGRITFFNRPPRMDDTYRAVQVAAYPYGAETWERNLLYAIDYTAGYEKSDDVPADLRDVVAKKGAIALLNNIGRGLMSGFSSSSLSLDGVSESFSSTQSATSAFYGADIKQYQDEIEQYIQDNKRKFAHLAMGAL
jgi:hypothetical protein